jgi:hypothetical protein
VHFIGLHYINEETLVNMMSRVLEGKKRNLYLWDEINIFFPFDIMCSRYGI